MACLSLLCLGLLLPTGARAVAARAARAPQIIGGFGIPALDTERFMAGAATIDPYRPYSGTYHRHKEASCMKRLSLYFKSTAATRWLKTA